MLTGEESDDEFAKKVIDYQLQKEKIAEDYARNHPEGFVIISDRSAIEPSAYVGTDKVRSILSQFGRKFEDVRDSYDLVLHLTTAAKGAEEFYTLENNAARSESAEDAIALDDRMLQVWEGHPNRIVIDNSEKGFDAKLKKIILAVETHIKTRLGSKKKSDDSEYADR